jgi:hypothetical protein
MNTVVFLTQTNKHDMAESIKRLADKQHDKVNGALIVCHQSAVSAKEALRIAAPLSGKYATGGLVKAATNSNISNDGQIAVMMARFVTLAYVRYPGPWLILDAPADAGVENWAEALLKQHRLNGGKVVGMGKQEGKSVLTYGPITIQLSAKTMRLLHFSTNESWRSRGRFLLMNAGLKIVPEVASVLTPSTKTSSYVDPKQNYPMKVAPLGDVEFAKPPLTPEKLEQLKKDVVALHAPDQISEPALTSADSDGFERASLVKAIEKATGKRPHHFTGIDKLRQMVQEIEQPA